MTSPWSPPAVPQQRAPVTSPPSPMPHGGFPAGHVVLARYW